MEDAIYPTPFETLNCRGQLLHLEQPKIMGILNVTPDSFFDGGRHNSPEKALKQAEKMLEQGADILDIGGYSSRPGADDIPVQQEIDRVAPVVELLRKNFPQAILSIDTFRAKVAQTCLEMGAHLINDISAGLLDEKMLETVAAFSAPYLLMHMPGTPQTMQQNTNYGDLFGEIWSHLVKRVNAAREAGIVDLIVDPGFGFGKTVEQNYALFGKLEDFRQMGLPLLVGISRKSMLYKPFNSSPDEVLDLTAALHLQAVRAGARILRVHDVAPAVRVRKVWGMLEGKF